MGLPKNFSPTLLQETLKQTAKNLSHHIVHWFYPLSENQSLIESFDSQLNVLRLVPFASTQKLQLVCMLWVSRLFQLAIKTFSPQNYSVVSQMQFDRGLEQSCVLIAAFFSSHKFQAIVRKLLT